MQQIPGQNRIFMAWYSQGTQVVDFTENADGTIDFKTAGWFIPEGSNQWVSAIFKAQRNPDGSSPTGARPATSPCRAPAATRSTSTRSRCRRPRRRTSRRRCPGRQPGGLRHVRRLRHGGGPAPGRGIRFDFNRRGAASARVRLLRVSRGRNVIRPKLVRDFGQRTRGFSWKGGTRIPSGHYVAEFTTKAPNGRTDRRRVACAGPPGGSCRCARSSASAGAASCSRPGWRSRCSAAGRNARATLSFRLREPAVVDVEIRRGNRVVRRIRAQNFAAGRTHKLNVSLPRSARRGEYTFTLRAEAAGRSSSATVVGRKL